MRREDLGGLRQEALIGTGVVRLTLLAADAVIEDVYAEERSSVHQALGQGAVFLAGLGRTGVATVPARVCPCASSWLRWGEDSDVTPAMVRQQARSMDGACGIDGCVRGVTAAQAPALRGYDEA